MNRPLRALSKLLIVLPIALSSISGIETFADTSQMQAYSAAMQIEESAKSADNSYSWQQAAQAWLKHYPNMVQSHDEKILAAKRSTACCVRAYEVATREGNKAALDNASQQLFAAYHRMEVLEPANPAWHYLLGVGCTTCGDYISARQSLSEAVKMAPNSDVAKKAITLANHNLPAVRQAQAAHDAYENSPQGKMHRQVDEAVRQGNLYAATHPSQNVNRNSPGARYSQWKQYNSNHAPIDFDTWQTHH